MSALRCPVCSEPKEKRWHLVCPYCWVKVPDADKETVYDLYAKKRGSQAHRWKCMEVISALNVARRSEMKAAT